MVSEEGEAGLLFLQALPPEALRALLPIAESVLSPLLLFSLLLLPSTHFLCITALLSLATLRCLGVRALSLLFHRYAYQQTSTVSH